MKIGAFSKLTRVSVRMLRYYDEEGLLHPETTDPSTGYRYYSAGQLPLLNRILVFQELGFSLRQIKSLLDKDLSLEQMRGMLLQKQAELQERVQIETERLARVAARLQQIDGATQGNRYHVVTKHVEPQLVVSVRDTISGYTKIESLFGRLYGALGTILGHPSAIWHDDAHLEEGIDAEALIYLQQPLVALQPLPPPIREYHLPAQLMVSVVHHGDYQTLPAAYDAILRWLELNPYQIDGANRELYLYHSVSSDHGDAQNVTEIQFPIAPTGQKV